MNLGELGARHDTDKLGHGYLAAYESLLGPLREAPIVLVEIGVHSGASIRMWEEWLPQATIMGIDNWSEAPYYKHVGRATIISGSVAEWTPPEPLDVVIDDGSHIADEVLGAFERLWPSVKSGGWYIVEDCHTQWWTTYGGDADGGRFAVKVHVLLAELLRDIGEPTEVAELHVWPQLLAMRKA